MKTITILSGPNTGEMRELTIERKGYDRRHRTEPPYFGERRQGERRGTWVDSDHRSANR